MKTKELIEHLKNLDPDGELEVTVGKLPIHFAQTLPSYYDGNRKELLRDASGKISGYKITREGTHIDLYTIDLEDFLWDYSKSGKIEVEFYPKELEERYSDKIKSVLKDIAECEAELRGSNGKQK